MANKTQEQIESSTKTMRSIEFIMGTNRENYDFRKDQDVIDLINGVIDQTEFDKRTENILKSIN